MCMLGSFCATAMEDSGSLMPPPIWPIQYDSQHSDSVSWEFGSLFLRHLNTNRFSTQQSIFWSSQFDPKNQTCPTRTRLQEKIQLPFPTKGLRHTNVIGWVKYYPAPGFNRNSPLLRSVHRYFSRVYLQWKL
jgi:hypothetical protein